MSNLPTKRVGPGGVQKIDPHDDHHLDALRYAAKAHMDEEHRYEETYGGRRHSHGQCIVITTEVEIAPPDRMSFGSQHIIRPRQMKIVLEVSWRVGGEEAYARRRTFQFDEPIWGTEEELRVKERIRRGEHLYGDEYLVSGVAYYRRDLPAELVIHDHGKVLEWLGTDWATAEPVEVKQLPAATDQLSDGNVGDIKLLSSPNDTNT